MITVKTEVLATNLMNLCKPGPRWWKRAALWCRRFLGVSGDTGVSPLPVSGPAEGMGSLSSAYWRSPSSLTSAAAAGDLNAISGIVASGTSVNSRSPDGHTALHYAAKAGQIEAVKLLLLLGADVAAATLKGNTPLHGAAYKGQVAIVRALLAAGADRTLQNADGETPLDRARAHDQLAVCEVLSA